MKKGKKVLQRENHDKDKRRYALFCFKQCASSNTQTEEGEEMFSVPIFGGKTPGYSEKVQK